MDRKEVITKAVKRFCSSLVIRKEDFLEPEWLEANKASGIAVMGFCWVATGAVYGMLGGPDSGYKIMSCKVTKPFKSTHYWLEDKETGEVFDPTAEQMPKNFEYKGQARHLRTYNTGKCLKFRQQLEKWVKSEERLN